MNDNSYEDSEVEISNLEGLFYDVPTLSEEEQKEIDKMIKEVEDKGFKDKFFALAEETERKRKNILKIGSLHISKAACMIVIICLSTVLLGVTVYAAVLKHIKSLEVTDKGNYEEVSLAYNDYLDTSCISKIESFYKPIWIPDDYHVVSENKSESMYSIIYKSDVDGLQIAYNQYLPQINIYFSTENGKHENVAFGGFNGEYIETGRSNYLIVTDGVYLYSIIADDIDKQLMIQMLCGN